MAGELGDLSGFLKDGGVSNLDWFNVPERVREPLPRQTLDAVPDLEAAWSHTDEPPSTFVPNTGDAPRTVGDMSQVHGPLRAAPADIIRTARMVMMQSPTDPKRIAHALITRFDKESLRGTRTALSRVLAERGLLGGYYISAVDFPECNKGSAKPAEFVRRYALEAQFLLSKEECKDCINLQAGRCSVFHKQIVVEVPYTEELAEAVEQSQAEKGLKAASSEGKEPKERIRLALLSEVSKQPEAIFTGRPQQNPKKAMVKAASKDQALAMAGQLAKENEATDRRKIAIAKAKPIVSMLRREMLKGRSEKDLIHALRLAFDVRLLQETRSQWGPIFKEAGLYGVVYMHQTDFDDCRQGADFVNKHGSMLRTIVAGSKCSSCIFSQAGRCLMYGRKLVANASDALTSETVAAVLDEHKLAGRLPPAAVKQHWGNTPAEELKALHRAATTLQPTVVGDTRAVIEKAFYGSKPQKVTSSVTKREIVKVAARYMNEGLYGEELGRLLKSQFAEADLLAAREALKTVIAEQGLQGIKFIDPTVYDDYGHGCATAARLHRSRTAVKYVKVGKACGSCVHQSMPGTCSVLAKTLVIEPPYVDKKAEQQAILASGKSTEVDYQSLLQNGLTVMQEYQLQNSGEINLNPKSDDPQVKIEFGTGDQGIKL